MKLSVNKKLMKNLLDKNRIGKDLTNKINGAGLPDPHTKHKGDCQPHTKCGAAACADDGGKKGAN